MGFGWRQKYGEGKWAVGKAAVHVIVAIPATWFLIWGLYRWGAPEPRLGALCLLMEIVMIIEIVHLVRGQSIWKTWLDIFTWFGAALLVAWRW